MPPITLKILSESKTRDQNFHQRKLQKTKGSKTIKISQTIILENLLHILQTFHPHIDFLAKATI